MFYSFFCISILLAKCICFEIEEYEMDLPYELLPTDYENVNTTFKSSTNDDSPIQPEDSQTDGAESAEELTTESAVSFLGPVKAKGTVSVAATFGYEAPFSYPMGASWFSPVFSPHNFFLPPLSTPMPFALPHIPLSTIIMPGNGNIPFPEDLLESLKDTTEKSDGEIFLKFTPLLDAEENSSKSNNLPDQVESSDEDFTDYDEEEITVDLKPLDSGLKSATEVQEPLGLVFGGIVPARGSVKIAARF